MRGGHSVRHLLLAIATTAMVAACGDDGPDRAEVAVEEPEALPSPVGSGFTAGEFDDIPVFRGATPVQGPSEMDGAVTASYETTSGAPEGALRFYEENLPELGWEPADPVRETSDGVWRGDWVRDGRRLQVVAMPFSPEELSRTQFSLVLLEDTDDIPVGAPPSTT